MTLTTVDEGISYYLKWSKVKHTNITYKNYSQCLKDYSRFVDGMPICDIELLDVFDYLHSLQERGLNKKTIYNRATVVREMYRFISKNPSTDVFFDPDTIPVPKPGETLRYRCSDNDICNALQFVDGKNHLRTKAIMYVLMDTGIRVAELCEIKRVHITLDRLELQIISKKSGKVRGLHFSTFTRDILKQYLSTHNSDYLISNRDGNMCTTRLIQRSVERASAGKFTPHQIRHYFATTFVKSGGNMEALSKCMGHASVIATQNYTKMNSYEIFDEQEKYLSHIHRKVDKLAMLGEIS